MVDLATGRRTSWVPDLDGNVIGVLWQRVPGRGVMYYFTNGNTFGFYPRAELPLPVTGLSGAAATNHVDLSWNPVDGATSYVVEVGSQPGAADLLNVDSGSTSTTLSGDAPDGVYYVRVHARGEGGDGPPSNELRIALGAGACAGAPAPPAKLQATVDGRRITLHWTAAAGTSVSRYLVEIGTASGMTNVGSIDVALETTLSRPAPPGTYFVRVVAENRCGVSGPSNEIRLDVP